MHFEKAGDVEQGHEHGYDHVTLLAVGSLLVTVNNCDTIFDAPQMIFIDKDKCHRLEARVDNTIACCIHATRDENGSIIKIDDSMIPNGVNLNVVNRKRIFTNEEANDIFDK
jgi:hypothetical protein